MRGRVSSLNAAVAGGPGALRSPASTRIDGGRRFLSVIRRRFRCLIGAFMRFPSVQRQVLHGARGCAFIFHFPGPGISAHGPQIGSDHGFHRVPATGYRGLGGGGRRILPIWLANQAEHIARALGHYHFSNPSMRNGRGCGSCPWLTNRSTPSSASDVVHENGSCIRSRRQTAGHPTRAREDDGVPGAPVDLVPASPVSTG